MEAKDLRIGVMLYDSLRDKNIEISLKYFKELDISEKNFFERYKPIPLTEEWLLKMNFEIKHIIYNDVVYGRYQFYIYKSGSEFYRCTYGYNSAMEDDCWLIEDDAIEIKSVSQLQNLFFALTGEELTLTETPCPEKE